MAEVRSNRYRLFYIAQSDLIDWIKIIFRDEPSVFLSTVTHTKISMPKDVRVMSIFFDYTKAAWAATLESSEWPEVPEGELVPTFDHIFAEKIRTVVIPVEIAKGTPTACEVTCSNGEKIQVDVDKIFRSV